MWYFTGVGLAFFLIVLLLSKRPRNVADNVLTWWLFVMMSHLALVTFFRINVYPELLGIELPFPLLHGPLLYLYTVALTRGKLSIKDVAIHLAVPAAFYAYLIPSFLFRPTAEKIFVYEHQGIGYETFIMVRDIAIPMSGVLYVTLATLALRKHRQTIVTEFSSLEKVNLLWLQYLIVWIALIWVLVFIGNDDLIYGATVIFIFFIGFLGMRQGGIFTSTDSSTKMPEAVTETIETDSAKITKAKYRKSGLSEDTAILLHSQLVTLMETDKVFRDSELSLANLAERLDVPANYLSQVINEKEGKNFYDYINSLRVQEFIQLSQHPESRKLTLFAVAQSCGFNSKSSFNRYFKKATGLSPSEYVQVPQSK